MIRFVVGVCAVLLILLGLVALISPIPIGVILMAFGLSMLVCVSDRARFLLKKLRSKYHKINMKLHALENKLEKRFSFVVDAFVQTRPSEKQDD